MPAAMTGVKAMSGTTAVPICSMFNPDTSSTSAYDEFGSSMAVMHNGRLVVGAPHHNLNALNPDSGSVHVYEGMLIIGKDFGEHSNVTLNLGYEEEGDENDTTWALGVKTPISADPNGIAAGIEVMGSFEDTADNWSILPGVYMPLGAENIVLKSGLEFGRADGATGMRANATLMYKY